jgi:hypothetical protein
MDYTDDCPKECFRAQITKDLMQWTNTKGILFSWMSFKGTDECKQKEVTE